MQNEKDFLDVILLVAKYQIVPTPLALRCGTIMHRISKEITSPSTGCENFKS